MPARSMSIYVLANECGQPGLILNFPCWWDCGGFMERFRAREIDLDNPIDANLAWLLTGAEAVDWDERAQKQFSENPLSDNPNVMDQMRRLASALRRASWVVVESCEWESGQS